MAKKINTPPLLKHAFQKSLMILSKVETPVELEKAKEDISKIIRETARDIVSGNWKPEDLAVTVTLNKPVGAYVKNTPEHVKVALELLHAGYPVHEGDGITYLKGKKKPIPLKLYRNPNEVDKEKYLQLLISTFTPLQPLGLNVKDIVVERTTADTTTQQSLLTSFFGVGDERGKKKVF